MGNRGICNIRVGNQYLALAYFPEYEAYMAFNRIKNGEVINVTEIDEYGNTPEFGMLDRFYVYHGVLWAVWAQYYPGSEVLQ